MAAMSSPQSPIPTTFERRPTALDAPTLQEWLASAAGPRLLDVRTPDEFQTAHIPGSYNVPLDVLRAHRAELREHLDDDVVLICRSGARAGQAEALLSATELPNVHVLVGGVTAWEATGGTLNRGVETWELERQVRLVAGAIVLSGVLLSVVAPWTKWISAAIGAGLVGAALTNSCLMGMMLARMPWNRRTDPDLETVLHYITSDDVN